MTDFSPSDFEKDNSITPEELERFKAKLLRTLPLLLKQLPDMLACQRIYPERCSWGNAAESTWCEKDAVWEPNLDPASNFLDPIVWEWVCTRRLCDDHRAEMMEGGDLVQGDAEYLQRFETWPYRGIKKLGGSE